MTAAPPPSPPSSTPYEPPPWAPPPPPAPPARTSLRRSVTDRMIGGVAGGLAEYSGIDPLLWRVGWVAFALMGPGVPVYLLLWVLTPSGPGGQRSGSAAAQPPARARKRAPAGPRSPIPGITLAGVLILVGLLVLLTRFTGWDLGARGFLGTALLVVGLGLIAGALTGRVRGRGGLIVLGIVLSLALAVSSSTHWHVGDGVGDRTYRPLTAADVRGVYHGGVGDLTLDLSDVPLGSAHQPIRTEIDTGVGDLHVIIPPSADVQVDVHSGLGDVHVFGNRSDSGFFPGSGASWSDDGRPEYVLTIQAGVGDVEVSRG